MTARPGRLVWPQQPGDPARPARLERLFLCCINLSGLTLASDDFPAYVCETFAAAGVPLNRICFELTETAIMANAEDTERCMQTIRALGPRFSLDHIVAAHECVEAGRDIGNVVIDI